MQVLPSTISLMITPSGRIEFKDVSFRALKKINFVAEPGTKVGICGPSGVGKSTILKLLCRFNDPDSGTILIDGQPLKELNYSSYSRHLGVVPQESSLFNDTVLFNLRY